MTWTTAFGNVQRTSSTADEAVGACHPLAFIQIDAFVPHHIQPIVNNDSSLTYMGVADGVHAINLPAGTHAWSFGTQSPVGDTPTWHDGYLYVPCLDGYLYKINATTGVFVWAYDAVRYHLLPRCLGHWGGVARVLWRPGGVCSLRQGRRHARLAQGKVGWDGHVAGFNRRWRIRWLSGGYCWDRLPS